MQCPCGGSTTTKTLSSTKLLVCESCGRVLRKKKTLPPEIPGFVVLTPDLVHAGGSGYTQSGFTYAQLLLLGVRCPPPKGWVNKLTGTYLQQERYDAFLAFKGNKKRIARRQAMDILENLPERSPEAPFGASEGVDVVFTKLPSGRHTWEIRYTSS